MKVDCAFKVLKNPNNKFDEYFTKIKQIKTHSGEILDKKLQEKYKVFNE